ncbi:MAG: TatD family deoxyribonuclease [Opitutus sp.]|nr:TatD family deoxyribonuclease [Opitutus sp.]
MGLIDTHTHLESFARHGTLPGALARAAEAGIEAMITIGTSPDDWAMYRDLADAHPGLVHYSVGLHPCSVEAQWEGAVAQIEAYWGRARPPGAPTADVAVPAVPPYPVALGEIGLDRFHLPKDTADAEKIFAWQRGAFAAQLAIARRLDCPVVVHSRGAFHECVEMIDASGVNWTRVVFHCFTEGEAEMAELVRRGGFGSFTGVLTYKSAVAVRAAAKVQGLARFMVETDAPYLTPMPHRGKPNEPAFVRHTAEFAATEVFGVSYEALATLTTANARRFFRI